MTVVADLYFGIIMFTFAVIICYMTPRKAGPAIMLVMLLIILWQLSDQTGSHSQILSDGLASTLHLPRGIVVRKIFGHALPNIAIGLLAAWIFSDEAFGQRSHWLIPVLICLFWALIDEYHQMFVGGRVASYVDAMIDFISALCGISLVFLKSHNNHSPR